jgi:hypothetical protein
VSAFEDALGLVTFSSYTSSQIGKAEPRNQREWRLAFSREETGMPLTSTTNTDIAPFHTKLFWCLSHGTHSFFDIEARVANPFDDCHHSLEARPTVEAHDIT